MYHYSAQAPQPPQKPKKEKKPMSRGKKLAVKITAGVLACLMVSAGSIAGFAALINGGYISVNTTSTAPAFTINKMVDEDGNTPTQTTTSGELTLNEIAQKVIPSVVCIQNFQRTNQQFYFGYTQQPSSEEQDAGEGSGIIATSDGYIITNAHVVEGADSLKVILYDGSTYEAELIGSDSVTDLAVVKIEAANLVPATFGSSSDLQVADQVMAVGNPGGLQFSSSVTVGYVSALDRPVTSEDGYTMNCIQTDAAINPGNSGGALVNKYGQVVGINSSKIAATGYEGLGFAIPIDDAQPVISSLKEYGYVRDRAVLGITGQYIDSMTARFYGFPTSGMYVASITNSSVSAAGITQGCMITKIDDVTVNSQTAITSYLTQKKPGDTVTLEWYNGLTGQTTTAQVTLEQSTGE
ncbi:MAG TPA: trypsin-like peptidase domain-containing protein [Candidatus Caccousia avistercoris]|nr:trypsin-like peptidase domain-containing protein [Candidatus Caccousia avistercoris]